MTEEIRIPNWHTGDREPDFVNDEGVKWWRKKIDWGHSVDLPEKCERLKLSWWYVELPDGDKSFVVIKDGVIIKESQGWESSACFIECATLIYDEELQ